jgi:hypothetical protein
VAWIIYGKAKAVEVAVQVNGSELRALQPVTNDAASTVLLEAPYIAEVVIRGVAPLLMHRWSCEDVLEKSKARKGSAAKKTDNVEAYIYRCDDGTIGIPGTYLIGSITDPRNGSAKYLQDPRSPRKSALDLYRAGVVSLTLCASLGKDSWDYIDQRRVTVQRAGITRSRPAFNVGWEATFQLEVLTPEYIRPEDLLTVLTQAGRLVGVGDFRPSYGRFQVVRFDRLTD